MNSLNLYLLLISNKYRFYDLSFLNLNYILHYLFSMIRSYKILIKFYTIESLKINNVIYNLNLKTINHKIYTYY